MGEDETKLSDTTGKFAQVVRGGRRVPDIEWISGRILLSNKRLVLASNEGKRTIPLSEIDTIRGRQDAAQPLAAVSSYLSVQTGDDVTLVAPGDHEEFERALYGAVLDQQTVLVDHPAVEGGVVQPTEWEKGRVTLEDGDVALAVASGQFVEIEIDDVGTVETKTAQIREKERLVVEVEHTVEGTAVETHVTAPRRKATVLASLFRKGEQQNTTEVDLSDEVSEVLMALYSGVSPFQIPEFVGIDVERVEEIYDELIESGLLEQRRVRREVELKARGRHVAGEASDEE